jgi:hypothetical protein
VELVQALITSLGQLVRGPRVVGDVVSVLFALIAAKDAPPVGFGQFSTSDLTTIPGLAAKPITDLQTAVADTGCRAW